MLGDGGDHAAGEADLDAADAPRRRACAIRRAPSISCSPRAAFVERNGVRTWIIAMRPSALTLLRRSSWPRASCAWPGGRRAAARRFASAAGSGSSSRSMNSGFAFSLACSIVAGERVDARVSRSAQRDEQVAVRLEERARSRLSSVVDVLDELGWQLAQPGRRAAVGDRGADLGGRRLDERRAPCRLRLTRASSLRRSRTAGASCGSRYEKSARSGRWNAIR